VAREPREDSPERSTGRASKANPREDDLSEEEAALLAKPKELTQANVRRYLSFALRRSLLQDDAKGASARYIELAGRQAGLWGGRGAPVGRKEFSAESAGPSLMDLQDEIERLEG
jgi:hypothetical protein